MADGVSIYGTKVIGWSVKMFVRKLFPLVSNVFLDLPDTYYSIVNHRLLVFQDFFFVHFVRLFVSFACFFSFVRSCIFFVAFIHR